jgi:Flp pilus assembly pilin Flp
MTRSTLRRLPAALSRTAAVRLAAHRRLPHLRPGHDDRGQATAEYGLIILAAGGIALGVIAWAGGTGTFTDMFESVVDKLSESL